MVQSKRGGQTPVNRFAHAHGPHVFVPLGSTDTKNGEEDTHRVKNILCYCMNETSDGRDIVSRIVKRVNSNNINTVDFE